MILMLRVLISLFGASLISTLDRFCLQFVRSSVVDLR